MHIRQPLISLLLCLMVAMAAKTGLIPPDVLVLGLRGVAIATMLLAARFGRTATVWLCSTLALATEFHRSFDLDGLGAGAMVSQLTALNLAVAGLLGERKSRMTTFFLCLLLGIEILVVMAPTALAMRLQTLLVSELSALPAGLEFALVGLAVVVVGWRFLRRRELTDGGLLITTAMVGIASIRPAEVVLWSGLAVLSVSVTTIESAFGLAYRDGLTGLRSRRSFDELLRRLPASYVIAMVDIDHFKRINDRHGHDVGDQVLRKVAGELASCGSAFRYGGEEFALVFAGRAIPELKAQLEELRSRIAGQTFVVRSSQRRQRRGGASTVKSLRVTVSIGAAPRGPKRRRAEDVLKAADRALYRAKRAGRNRVSVVSR